MATNGVSRWIKWPIMGAVLGIGAFVGVTFGFARPMVQASSFWPESVPELAQLSDLVVRGRLGDVVASYRAGESGTIGGDPSDDGIAAVVYEFEIDQVISGDPETQVVYLTYLDTDFYAGHPEFPKVAVVFLQHAVVDPADAAELSQFGTNLYSPLGMQGLFRVVGDTAESLSPEMRSIDGRAKGGPIPLAHLTAAVQAASAGKGALRN
jgi:hypothetical protein